MNELFGKLQKIGKALMLPVAVLPAAALLLRFGAPDMFDIPFVTKAGGAVFDNLPLLFAVGIGVGLSKNESGAAGLAGAVGYLVLTAAVKTLDEQANMGVLTGIIGGVVAGVMYNRFHTIKLPDYLGFFGGSRFVPIVTALTCLILAAVFGSVWGTCQAVIQALGNWIIGAGALGAFVYGLLNRLLVPIGLHHILNSFIWFVFGKYENPVSGVVATGDLNRFFAGDPTAGVFMAGFFPVMMFGLPAVALAMYRRAQPENRAKVGGILASVALTAFLTGITEPIEFMFMFLAPGLYAVHAIFTGLSMALACQLGILHGFGFSAGLIDYVINWGLATKPELILPLGVLFFALYYAVFAWAIERFDLPTVGRYDEGAAVAKENVTLSLRETAAQILSLLGGRENLAEIGNCATRLRVELVDPTKVDREALEKTADVRGVIMRGKSAQIIVGTNAEHIAREMKNSD